MGRALAVDDDDRASAKIVRRLPAEEQLVRRRRRLRPDDEPLRPSALGHSSGPGCQPPDIQRSSSAVRTAQRLAVNAIEDDTTPSAAFAATAGGVGSPIRCNRP